MTVAELKRTSTSCVFHRILVATDFSAASRRALCDALALAAPDDAHLFVVHAIAPVWAYMSLENPPELDTERIEAKRQMEEFVGNLDSEHKIEATFLQLGPVAEIVTLLIQDEKIDLLVIGTRGRGGIPKLALGSVAEELLRVAPCPVLTIGPHADIAPLKSPAEFHRILFATDFGTASAKALPLALALARAHQAKLTLLHMTPMMPASNGSLSAFSPPTAAADELLGWQAAMHQEALKQLQECVPAEAGLEQEPDYIVGAEFVPEGIQVAAVERKIDLIVMGANRVHAPRAVAHIPWMAVHEVVRNAPCPVLTVAG